MPLEVLRAPDASGLDGSEQPEAYTQLDGCDNLWRPATGAFTVHRRSSASQGYNTRIKLAELKVQSDSISKLEQILHKLDQTNNKRLSLQF